MSTLVGFRDIEANKVMTTGGWGATVEALQSGDLKTVVVNGTALSDYAASKLSISSDMQTLTISGVGTLKITANAKLKFTADASLAAGTYDFTGTNVDVTEVDASAMTNAFTLGTQTKLTSLKTGSGADKITLAGDTTTYAVNAGEGNDLVDVTVGLKAGSQIALGTGADTLQVSKGSDLVAATTVTGYSYTDGDVIVDDTASEVVSVANTGAISITGATALTLQAEKENDVYKVKYTVHDVAGEAWTAALGASAVTMDASGKTDVINMNAAAADSAYVTSGIADDQITLSAGKNTLSVGKASGKDTLAVNTLGSDDTVYFTGNGSLSDVTIAGGKVQYVKTTLDAAVADSVEGKVKVSFDSGKTTGMLAYAATAGTVTQATDVDYYLGDADGSTIVASKSVDMITDASKYARISAISLAAGASGNFIGTAGATGTFINAAAATNAVQIWGGSTAANIISLGGANKVADTVWFGTADGKGEDVVMDFDNGFATTSDVLKLYDTASLSSLKFSNATSGGLVIANGTSSVSLSATTANADSVEIMLSDGTIKKVATNTNADASINAAGADVVIGSKTATTAVYGASQSDALTVNLWDTDTYQNIVNVYAADATGAATVIGAKGKSSTLTLGNGNSQVWGGSTAANTIALKVNAGTDIVWYGGVTTDASLNDGADMVTGFSTDKDTVKFWDVGSVKEVFKDYQLASDGTDTTFTSKTNEASILTLKDVNAQMTTTIKATDSTNESIKAVVNLMASSVSNLAFATDAQIYAAGKTGSTVTIGNAVTGDVSLFLDNGDWFDTNSYYFGENITVLDGSNSTADLTLIGRDNAASTLKGGLTQNAMWGGGTAADEIDGSTAAVDTVWFGANDGNDTFASGADKGDTIHLYGVSSSDISSVYVTTDTDTEKVIVGAATLTIADTGNAALKGGLSFTTSDNVTYKYNTTTKTLAKA